MKTEQDIEFSSLDKIMFPEANLTKQDLLKYYDYMADYILPHLYNRPLMMQRFPNGVGENGFYQKNISDYFPDWIDRVTVEKEGGTVTHVLCNSRDTLLYLVNQGTISFHTWLSCAEAIYNPDKLVIDLDPSGNDFASVRKAAIALRALLHALALTSFVMTTGSRGLHIVVPLDGKEDFDESRKAGKILGNYLSKKNPDLLTLEQYKENREDNLYFDIQRNAYAQTSIAPYSLRPRQGATVATPIAWDEVTNSTLFGDKYHVGNIRRRLGQKSDPWDEYGKVKHSPSEIIKKMSDEKFN